MSEQLITTLLALALSALSIYLAYRERTEKRDAEYRHIIYSKQVEVYIDIINTMGMLHKRIMEFDTTAIGEQHIKQAKNLIEQTLPILESIKQDKKHWFIFTSEKVINQITSYYSKHTQFLQTIRDEEADKYNKNLSELSNQLDNIILEIRKALHIEPLSERTLKIIHTTQDWADDFEDSK